MVRWNEKVSLEFVTSVLGGVGCAYSLQSFVLIQGGQLGPSVIFLTASLLIIFGTSLFVVNLYFVRFIMTESINYTVTNLLTNGLKKSYFILRISISTPSSPPSG